MRGCTDTSRSLSCSACPCAALLSWLPPLLLLLLQQLFAHCTVAEVGVPCEQVRERHKQGPVRVCANQGDFELAQHLPDVTRVAVARLDGTEEGLKACEQAAYAGIPAAVLLNQDRRSVFSRRLGDPRMRSDGAPAYWSHVDFEALAT